VTGKVVSILNDIISQLLMNNQMVLDCISVSDLVCGW